MKASAGRILMLVENYYPQDTRVRNEANLLIAAGYEVSIICIRERGQASRENVAGVHVWRLPQAELFKKTTRRTDLNFLQKALLIGKSSLGYVFEYIYFTCACLVLASYFLITKGFDVIHAHNPPDTLFLVALPFKLIGKRFVFDHHDLCPELFMSRYRAPEGVFTRVLAIAEWCSLKLADVVIATNESYKEIQIKRAGKDPRRIFIVRNGPDQNRMKRVAPSQRLREMDKCILCYIGSLNPQDGVDYLLRSLHYMLHVLKRDDFHCVIVGDGDSLEDLRDLAKSLKLNGSVKLTGFVSDQELSETLAAADICVDPDPSSPLNDVSTWIKIMEYMAYEKPIVSFDLKETRYSAQDAAVFVPPNDEGAFATAIAELIDQPERRRRMGELGRARVERDLQWSTVGQNLLSAYESLKI